MRRSKWFLLNNWRAKLGSLLLATVLWLVIRHGIAYTPALPPNETAVTPPAISPVTRP